MTRLRAWIQGIVSMASTGRVLLALMLAAGLTGALAQRAVPACKVDVAVCPSPSALQLAFTPSRAHWILDTWSPAGATLFLRGLWTYDLAFPWLYALGLASLYRWVKATFKPRLTSAPTLPVAPLDVMARAAPWIALSADLVENVLTTVLVAPVAQGHAAIGWPPAGLTYVLALCCVLKWTAVLLALLGSSMGILLSQAGGVLWTCRFGVFSLLLGSLPLLASPQGRDVLRHLLEEGGAAAGTRALTFGVLWLWALSVWYWSRTLLTITTLRPATSAPERVLVDTFVAAVPRWLGTLTLLLAGLACLGTLLATVRPPAATANDARGDPSLSALRHNLVLAAALCVALAWAFHWAVARRRAWLRAAGYAVPEVEHSGVRPTSAARRLAVACLLVSLAFLVIFTFWPVPVAQTMGTLAVLGLFAANSVFFGSLTVLASRRWGLPVVSASLCVAVLFSFWNDGHRVPLLRPIEADDRRALETSFEAWLKPRLADWQRRHSVPYPVVLVAAEGGGVRAAYWTAAVLGRLQDLRPQADGRGDAFERHVFAISGVSGGSLGAAAFVALLADSRASGAPQPRTPPVETAQTALMAPQPGGTCCELSWGRRRLGPHECAAARMFGQNFLAPVLAKMLVPDLAQWFWPTPVPHFDRSRGLEQAWSDAYDALPWPPRPAHSRRFAEPFLDLWRVPNDAAARRDLPALFLNGTHVQTGRRLVTTNLRAALRDAFDTHETLGADLSLASAVHNSARFTYVSPAGRLLAHNGSDRGHVVDGGYFETSGATTLRDVLSALGTSAARKDVRFVVLHTCNDPAACGAYLSTKSTPVSASIPEAGPLAASDPVAPLLALFTTWGARAEAAVEDLTTQVKALGGVRVTFAVCPRADREDVAPLGWQLSPRSQRILTEQVGGVGCSANADALQRVQTCLTGGSCAAGEDASQPAAEAAPVR